MIRTLSNVQTMARPKFGQDEKANKEIPKETPVVTPTQTQVVTPKKGFKAPKWVMALAGLALGVAGTEAVNVPRMARLNQSNQTLSQSNETLNQKNLGLEIKTELLSRRVGDLEGVAKELDVENVKINIQNELLTRANNNLTEAAKTLDTTNKKLTQDNLSLSIKNELLTRSNGNLSTTLNEIGERLKQMPVVSIRATVAGKVDTTDSKTLWVVSDDATKEWYALKFDKEPPQGIQKGVQYQVKGKIELLSNLIPEGSPIRVFTVDSINKQQ